MSLSDQQIAGVVLGAGWAGHDATVAVAVVLAESGGDPLATNHNTNGSTDWGLFQINDKDHSDLLRTGSWQNPRDNARMAFTIYSQANHTFHDWVSFTTGRYLIDMPRASTAIVSPDENVSPPTGTTATPTGLASANPLQALVNLATFLANPANWVRLTYFVIGFVLMMVAVARFSGTANAVSSVAKDAAKVAIFK